MNITYAPAQTEGVTTLMSVSDFDTPKLPPVVIGAFVGGALAMLLGKKILKYAVLSGIGYCAYTRLR